MSLGTANAAMCDSLEDRPASNNSRCIEAFLFPDEGTGPASQLRQRVAQLAEQVDQQRKRVLAGYGMPASSTTDDMLAPPGAAQHPARSSRSSGLRALAAARISKTKKFTAKTGASSAGG